MFDSKEYWNKRYDSRGNSGVGSYGIYAKYKSEIINAFIKEKYIDTICELGCGDGNQLSLLNISKYYGHDVSSLIIKNNKEKFSDKDYFFSTDIEDFSNMKYDLTLSLDVIFHLIEDNVYLDYMNNLFNLSNKYVIIYSPNEDKYIGVHVKYRKFTEDIPKSFKLLKMIDNPHKGEQTMSDFYIFENNNS